MDEISVSEFRQQCLALMDDLPAEGILITRHGHPVARLVPVRPRSCVDLIGTIPILLEGDDDLFSTGERWDAES
jgi:prevent-host-death family protein